MSRLNALKTGIDARSAVIRGENPEALEDLALDYHARFQPSTPEQSYFVDALVHAEWQLRRLRKIEAELWEAELLDAERWDRFRKKCPLGDAFYHALNAFTRLQRRIDSAERSYHRSLTELRRLQSAAPAPQPLAVSASQLPEVPAAQPLAPEFGFVPSPASRAAAGVLGMAAAGDLECAAEVVISATRGDCPGMLNSAAPLA